MHIGNKMAYPSCTCKAGVMSKISSILLESNDFHTP